MAGALFIDLRGYYSHLTGRFYIYSTQNSFNQKIWDIFHILPMKLATQYLQKLNPLSFKA